MQRKHLRYVLIAAGVFALIAGSRQQHTKIPCELSVTVLDERVEREDAWLPDEKNRQFRTWVGSNIHFLGDYHVTRGGLLHGHMVFAARPNVFFNASQWTLGARFYGFWTGCRGRPLPGMIQRGHPI